MHKKELQTAFNTRQYMYSKDFEIYYYNDMPLNTVTAHTHNYYEFYFFLEGNVTIYVEGKPHPIKSGDFLLIPPGVEHYPVFLDNTPSTFSTSILFSNKLQKRFKFSLLVYSNI